ncbi:MAG: glutaminase A [Pseudomonadota bacterium]
MNPAAATSITPELLAKALSLGRAAARDGRPASYIPELACADPAAVGIATCDANGEVLTAGDAHVSFTLQSVSKVFALACVLRSHDAELWQHVSMEPSGDAFHSIVRLEEEHGRPRNPLINAGAIVVSDRLHGEDPQGRIAGFRQFLCAASGQACTEERFALNERVYRSECRTGFRNRALANYMRHFAVVSDPETAIDTYFRQCSLEVTAAELARVGLLFAAGGTDPATGRRLLACSASRKVVALMATCGLYDEVGRFAVEVGLPAKSGVSGAILAIVPGRYSIACYGPALGERGNSLAGMAMLKALSGDLGLSVFGE